MDKETAKKKIEELVKDYDEYRNQYSKTGYSEQQFCIHVLNKFFKALGWDVDNEEKRSEYYCDVSFQYKLKSEESTKFPDYAFGYPAKTNPKFFVEAKTPSTKLKTERGPAHQIRSYGRSAELARSILTNFEEFAIYGCSKKPKQSDNAAVGLIDYFTYKEYSEKFDFLWDTFSIEGVRSGRYDKYAQTDTKKKGSVPLDKEFVETLNKWRKYLAKNIAQKNKKLTSDEVNYTVQQTIDRIIFLRFCEDRNIERFGTLKDAIQKDDYYKNLFNLFKEANKKYNSGLFDIKKDNITSKIKVENSVIKDIIEELYRPKSEYEFGVMPLEILGNAYEEFLGKVIRVTPGRIVKINIDKKPEVQKAGGVFYTPQYIVNYIVENTVGKLIKGKTPNEIKKIKIVDPACGSGSFLLGAYVYLLRYHTDYYWKKEYHKKRIEDNPLTPDGQLTVTEKKQILLNNLYGVDIDPNAVEVTKLSLLLKAMEGETEASVAHQLNLYEKGILPDLDNNIKCGNSLINYEYEDSIIGGLDEEEKNRLRLFDWGSSFPEIFKYGGFDVVLGNPPWVSLSGKFGNEILSTNAQQYLINKYKGNTYMPNLYEYFIHKGLELVNKDGYFSFIVPDRLGFNSQYINLRKKILEQYKVEELIYKAKFPNIVTDTLIFRIANPSKKTKGYEINVGEYGNELQVKTCNEYLKDKEYKFSYETSNVIGKVLDKLFNLKRCKSLGLIIETTSGFGGKSEEITDKRINQRQIKIIRGRSIQKYSLAEFFYFEFKPANITGRTTDRRKLGVKEKVLLRKTGPIIFATYDDSGIFPEQSLYFLFNNKTQLSLKYLTALINSKLFQFVYWHRLVTNRDSTPQLKKNDLDRFPVFILDLKKEDEKSVHDEIIRKVDALLLLNKDIRKTMTPAQHEQIKNKISALENRINALVCEIYGIISKKDIETIEKNIKL